MVEDLSVKYVLMYRIRHAGPRTLKSIEHGNGHTGPRTLKKFEYREHGIENPITKE